MIIIYCILVLFFLIIIIKVFKNKKTISEDKILHDLSEHLLIYAHEINHMSLSEEIDELKLPHAYRRDLFENNKLNKNTLFFIMLEYIINLVTSYYDEKKYKNDFFMNTDNVVNLMEFLIVNKNLSSCLYTIYFNYKNIIEKIELDKVYYFMSKNEYLDFIEKIGQEGIKFIIKDFEEIIQQPYIFQTIQQRVYAFFENVYSNHYERLLSQSKNNKE